MRVHAGDGQLAHPLRVWDRGAGETLACGTGACAAVVAGIRLGRLDANVDVQTHGGLLTIEWAGDGTPVFVTGPAITVFEGEIEVPDSPMKTDGMNPITEDDIANYLANTPDFFARHAQLLAAVQLTSPHGHRAVSLQERQAEMLREKIKALEHRLDGHGAPRQREHDHRGPAASLGAQLAPGAVGPGAAGHDGRGNPEPVHGAAGGDQGLGRGRPLRRRGCSPKA